MILTLTDLIKDTTQLTNIFSRNIGLTHSISAPDFGLLKKSIGQVLTWITSAIKRIKNERIGDRENETSLSSLNANGEYSQILLPGSSSASTHLCVPQMFSLPAYLVNFALSARYAIVQHEFDGPPGSDCADSDCRSVEHYRDLSNQKKFCSRTYQTILR